MIFFVKRPNIKMPVIVTYGIFFGAGIWGLVNLAVSLGTPAGISSLLLQSSAFFTILAAILFFKEELPLRKLMGLESLSQISQSFSFSVRVQCLL